MRPTAPFRTKPPSPMPHATVETASSAANSPRPADLRSPSDCASGNTRATSVASSRKEESARPRQLFAETREVTLVGPGLVGKTRLALRLAASLHDAFADGTWLVALSPICDPPLVPQVPGDALSMRLPPGIRGKTLVGHLDGTAMDG
jgi:hypothetical protein